ncbi:MAG: hypothetical protein ABFD92_19060 [Planctomycetaceae bacterium]|nr:hypothetical protein [Planctomycetaceae bacterium]
MATGDDASRGQLPQEQPAVRTTIVGGRPPGAGKGIGAIPRGIEVLVKKASVDPAFRKRLLEARAAAAGDIGLKLTETEAAMLAIIPQPQLEAIINNTRVDPSNIAAFLGKAAAAMLLALGITAGGCDFVDYLGYSFGHRTDQTPNTPSSTASQPTTSRPQTDQGPDIFGMVFNPQRSPSEPERPATSTDEGIGGISGPGETTTQLASEPVNDSQPAPPFVGPRMAGMTIIQGPTSQPASDSRPTTRPPVSKGIRPDLPVSRGIRPDKPVPPAPQNQDRPDLSDDK